MQRICEIISKTAIHENLDPRKFSAIRYWVTGNHLKKPILILYSAVEHKPFEAHSYVWWLIVKSIGIINIAAMRGSFTCIDNFRGGDSVSTWLSR